MQNITDTFLLGIFKKHSCALLTVTARPYHLDLHFCWVTLVTGENGIGTMVKG